MSEFAGQGVLVTGGAPGIVAATVRAFHAQGAQVAIADIDVSAGEVLAALSSDVASSRAAAILFLASEQASFIAGAALPVDGGFSLL